VTSAVFFQKGCDSCSSFFARSHEQPESCHTRDQKLTTFPLPLLLPHVNTAFPFAAFEWSVILYIFVFKCTYLVISGKVHMNESLVDIIPHQSHLLLMVQVFPGMTCWVLTLYSWRQGWGREGGLSIFGFLLPLNTWEQWFCQNNFLCEGVSLILWGLC
jgi:hypothetical protein